MSFPRKRESRDASKIYFRTSNIETRNSFSEIRDSLKELVWKLDAGHGGPSGCYGSDYLPAPQNLLTTAPLNATITD
jgi:hypothetical protein